MNLFHSVLYINGLPVDYNVASKNETTFLFEPFFNLHMGLEAPIFTVEKQGDILVFDDICDEVLKDQVREDLESYFKMNAKTQ
jgi:hypothetical protein